MPILPAMMLRLDTPMPLPDPDATDALAAALAPRLDAGDTVLLEGDLGAGKSHLARAIIRAKQARHGPPDEVPSPTYTLLQTYRAGETEIAHADLYRLGDPSELVELGLDDLFGRALCLVEWPERLAEARPADALTVSLAPEGAGRVAILSGPSWATRL